MSHKQKKDDVLGCLQKDPDLLIHAALKMYIKLAVEYLSLLHSDSDVFVVSSVGVILKKILH